MGCASWARKPRRTAGGQGLLHGVDQRGQPQLPILAAPPYALPLLHRSIRLVAKAASGTPWPKNTRWNVNYLIGDPFQPP